MLTQASPILFKAIKVYGLGTIFFESIFSVFNTMEIDLATLTYTLAIEGVFMLLKTLHVQVPMWVEALQDLF
jgi:hypothetical protein